MLEDFSLILVWTTDLVGVGNVCALSMGLETCGVPGLALLPLPLESTLFSERGDAIDLRIGIDDFGLLVVAPNVFCGVFCNRIPGFNTCGDRINLSTVVLHKDIEFS